MARIILSPGETFEHCHSAESSTILRHGCLRCTFGERVVDMQAGDVLAIPAHVPHTLENTGAGRAHVDCQHGPAIEPEADEPPPPNP